jgi:hypothetical protein
VPWILRRRSVTSSRIRAAQPIRNIQDGGSRDQDRAADQGQRGGRPDLQVDYGR